MDENRWQFTTKELFATTAIVAGCVFISLQAGWIGGTAVASCVVAAFFGYFGRRPLGWLAALFVGWLVCFAGACVYWKIWRWPWSHALETLMSAAPVLLGISALPIVIAWAIGRSAKFTIEFEQLMKENTNREEQAPTRG
jgi:hypothetical protein